MTKPRAYYFDKPPTKPAEGEQGWLTPLRTSKGDGSYTVFRCRCGGEAIKRTRDVRRDAAAGLTPKCRPSCTGTPTTAAPAAESQS